MAKDEQVDGAGGLTEMQSDALRDLSERFRIEIEGIFKRFKRIEGEHCKLAPPPVRESPLLRILSPSRASHSSRRGP